MGISMNERIWKVAVPVCCVTLLSGQAAMASFMPPQSQSLQIWLEADTGVLDADGNDVTGNTESSAAVQWLDQSGNDNHAFTESGQQVSWRPSMTEYPFSDREGDMPVMDMRSRVSGWGPMTVNFDEPFSSDEVTAFVIHN